MGGGARATGLVMTARARTAALVGILAGLATGVDLLRWMRAGVLADPEPSWAPARLVLGLAAAAGAAAAGIGAAALFSTWERTRSASRPLEPLPFRRSTLVALTLAAILVGTALRFASLSRLPESLWIDDVSMISPALNLLGSASDFTDAIRPTPYGVAQPYGSVGVLYLEGFRGLLRVAGTTVFGVRLPSALAGAASLVTAALLGRALLPAGGGMLAALIIAGLRWHLILSRWAFVMILAAPIVDLATLALIASRRRRQPALALAAGAIAGVGAHVYLSAWSAGAALVLFALWPSAPDERLGRRAVLGAAFALGFAACAAPLFLFRENRTVAYFARTADHNVVLEMRRERSLLPPAAAAADALASPWFLADPTARHDLPGRRRLPWVLGIPVAIALGRALLRLRELLSGLLLSHAAAFLASNVAGGQADLPNGSRFAYLASVAAVAAAAGLMWLVDRTAPRRRRAVALAAVGIVAVAGVISARDALVVWSEHPETFRGFHGQDTLIGRAAARWDPYGSVSITPGLGHSPVAVEEIRRYRLDPDLALAPAVSSVGLRLRIVSPDDPPGVSERIVERIADPRGRTWALVLARQSASE
jgi:hypothetical protein